MAYYVNGTLISGANTLPKMTMAEYLALPSDQRPTYWECTDKDYVDITAENVSYGSGTVEQALNKMPYFKSYNGTFSLTSTVASFDITTNISSDDYANLKYINAWAVDSGVRIYNCFPITNGEKIRVIANASASGSYTINATATFQKSN